jgi:lipoprotein-anchoring transpeptidase ErfK/SrfK
VEPDGYGPLITRVITPDDVAGPFTESIPADLAEQAKLTALNYTSPLEALAERYHSSPALLQKLNPGARFAAGETVKVPERHAARRRQAATPTASVTIVVSKSASSLTVLDESGGVMFHAPVTSGSEHDPLPLGSGR